MTNTTLESSTPFKLFRERYQKGSLTTENRNNGPVWVYRWRETAFDGRVTKRKRIVGTKREFPTKASAWKVIDGLRLDINSNTVSTSAITVDELIAHYKLVELVTDRRTARTKAVYRQKLDQIISPRWGSLRLSQVKPNAVEGWLNEMSGASGTKYKTKSVFSNLFQHAMRNEWAERNPIKLVRQGATPQQEEIVLEPLEVQAIMSELREPVRTVCLLAAVSGLRRSELFGLKWADIDFAKEEIRIVRSLVDQVEGQPKTVTSRRPIPMSPILAAALAEWRRTTDYAGDHDWVCASPWAMGRKPYWPSSFMRCHIVPAAIRAGVEKKIGWHSFRRTLATLLSSSGVTIRTTQELLRHASPTVTLGIYAKALTRDKREAQEKVVAMLLPNRNLKNEEWVEEEGIQNRVSPSVPEVVPKFSDLLA
jgi:integrase